MGFSKKTAKGRLDKYYHLAKEQGYRARSAFKLVQLNKKYEFLQQSRVVIDLCAAPGGWCQVAAKFMPKGQIIIGVDLVPIKPISGVITMVNDITTEKCRTDLKRELKDWKADVVLHDGAPNVGKSWLQDAYTQSELVLSSLKLATEFLAEGGWFVTKVFRSKDYNSLMWVFGQLFQKVEATKPSSSRDVSAEIFVVCKGYLAPKSIDPRFLDPKSVFTDIDSLMKPIKLGNLLQPSKQKRNRGGYEDGVNVLFKKLPVMHYIKQKEFADLLATSNCIAFESSGDEGDDDAIKKMLAVAATSEEVKSCCQDLKVLGPREYKVLIKWRLSMRKLLGLEQETEKPEEEVPAPSGSADAEDDLTALNESLQKKMRHDKRKALERKAKLRMKLNLKMNTANDLAEDAADLSLFSLKKLKKTNFSNDIDDEDAEAAADQDDSSDFEPPPRNSGKDLDALDDEERILRLEEIVDAQYEEQRTQSERRRAMRLEEEEAERENLNGNGSDFDSAQDGEAEAPESVLVDIQRPEEARANEKAKVSLWYSNPLFQSISALSREMAKHQPEKKAKNAKSKYQPQPFETIQEEIKPESKKGSQSPAPAEQAAQGIEFVPAQDQFADYFDEDEAREALTTAEGMELATRIASGNREKMRESLIDETFNRYAYPDRPSDLPSWFIDDESQHNKPTKPITKEAAEALKLKMKELNNRPIKKIMEAKGRNKARGVRRLEGLKKKAEAIFNSEDIGEKAKLVQISKMLRKKTVTKREKPSLVVAKGTAKGVKGRPSGIKGRYKMVDRRMIKELRAQKRVKAKLRK